MRLTCTNRKSVVIDHMVAQCKQIIFNCIFYHYSVHANCITKRLDEVL